MEYNGDFRSIASFYTSKLAEFGVSHKTVGWGSIEDQFLRFRMLLRGLSPKGKVVLDVGCGLGDLVTYLHEETSGDFEYIGIDITESLILKAREIHDRPNCKFFVGDLEACKAKNIDISLLSGALTYKTPNVKRYARETMQRMFQGSKEAACLNFMSKYSDFELDKNQHYCPGEVLSWSYALSRFVNLYGDYPLYEFTVQLKHDLSTRL